MGWALPCQTCATYDVREITCHEFAWTWVLLELETEYLPVVKMPRSPQRLAKAWSLFADAVMERRITHDGDPRVARHLANLTLRSDRSGLRPDLDRTQAGSPISASLGAMWAASRVLEKQGEPEIIPGFVLMDDDEQDDLDRYFGET